ncbi:hypothetical protein ACFXGM_19580 [Streptomyces albidoflavus]
MPRQRRSGRGGQPFIVVLPDERRSWKHKLALAAGRAVWRHRRALTPTFNALAVLPLTALLHALAWWVGLGFAPLAAAPLVSLLILQRRRPASGTGVLRLRIAVAVLATAATAWVALAVALGPLAGPLGVLWLLLWGTAQTGWLIVHRTA